MQINTKGFNGEGKAKGGREVCAVVSDDFNNVILLAEICSHLHICIFNIKGFNRNNQ